MKITRIITIGISVPVGLVVAMISLVLVQRLLGYYPGSPGWEVAEIAAARKDISVCQKILDVPWNFILGFGPSSREMRADCIHDYAKLTKDPSACELLMPSSYGRSCLGAASDSEPCVFLSDGQGTVKGQGIVTTYDECLSGPPATQQHTCCVMARITFDETNDDNCDVFAASDALSDQCHHEVALKRKDASKCRLMKNERNRTACEIGVKASQ